MLTGLKTLDEVRQAVAVLATGNADALDRLVWAGVFGPTGAREAARQGVLEIGEEMRPIPVVGRCLNEDRQRIVPAS